MAKHKPQEKILLILRALSKEHPEQSLGSHLTLATQDTNLELLSDKTLLEYLQNYKTSIDNTTLAEDLTFLDGDNSYAYDGDEDDYEEEDEYGY